MSRFPISNHDFKLFLNPRFELTRPDGESWISHNKGISKCTVKIETDKAIQVATLHLIPFRKFGVEPLEEKIEYLRTNIADLARMSGNAFLLQGDFNFDDESLKQFLPKLFSRDISEVLLDGPTTPRGRKYDHIVYHGLKHLGF